MRAGLSGGGEGERIPVFQVGGSLEGSQCRVGSGWVVMGAELRLPASGLLLHQKALTREAGSPSTGDQGRKTEGCFPCQLSASQPRPHAGRKGSRELDEVSRAILRGVPPK